MTVVARPDHVDAIRSGGLRLIGRETVTARVDAVTALETIAPGTTILLTTKVNASEAALAPIADLVRDDTVIVCVQNGLDSEGIARRAVGGRGLVLRAITQFGAIFQEPGLINYTAAGYTLLEDGPRTPAIAAMLTGVRPRRPHLPRHQDRDLAKADLQLRDQPDHRRSPAPRSAASPIRVSIR